MLTQSVSGININAMFVITAGKSLSDLFPEGINGFRTETLTEISSLFSVKFGA